MGYHNREMEVLWESESELSCVTFRDIFKIVMIQRKNWETREVWLKWNEGWSLAANYVKAMSPVFRSLGYGVTLYFSNNLWTVLLAWATLERGGGGEGKKEGGREERERERERYWLITNYKSFFYSLEKMVVYICKYVHIIYNYF